MHLSKFRIKTKKLNLINNTKNIPTLTLTHTHRHNMILIWIYVDIGQTQYSLPTLQN